MLFLTKALVVANVVTLSCLAWSVGQPLVQAGNVHAWPTAQVGTLPDADARKLVLPGEKIVTRTPAGETFSCTLGLAWQLDSGERVLTTAGHCLGEEDEATVSFPQATPFGSAERIKGSDLAVVHLNEDLAAGYVRIVSSEAVGGGDVPVTAVAEDLQGLGVCVQGSATGASCGWRVLEEQVSVTTESGTSPLGALATGKGWRCVDHGDSGGPVFGLREGAAVAAGIMSATNAFTPAGPLLPQVCSIFFLPVEQIQRQLGGHALLAEVQP